MPATCGRQLAPRAVVLLWGLLAATSPGATLGPAMTFAYLAARDIAQSAQKPARVAAAA